MIALGVWRHVRSKSLYLVVGESFRSNIHGDTYDVVYYPITGPHRVRQCSRSESEFVDRFEPVKLIIDGDANVATIKTGGT